MYFFLLDKKKLLNYACFTYKVRKRFIYWLFFLLGMDKGFNDGNGKTFGETNAKENILEKTGKEYFNSGEDELKKERFNSSVVLYFKDLVTFSDLFLLKKTGDVPSSHNARFRVTENKFQEIYDLLDKDFPFYQDSYHKIMSKELAEVIKNDAETVAKKAEIKL